jgi:hypothetical protein
MTRTNGAGHHRAERHCAAMIKIRYRDANEFCPGLHATAERHGRTVTVYLLRGLTAAERKAAFRRLRLSGRRGCGPQLAAPQLALALFVDRIGTAIARAGSVVRSHPAGTTGPVMLISAGAIAFLVLSAAVSIHILRPSRHQNGSSAFGPAPAASALAVRIPSSSQDLADGPAGSKGQVLTSVLSAPDSLPVPNSPDVPGAGSGVNPSTASTGTDGGSAASTATASSGHGSGNGTGGSGTGGNGTGGSGTTVSAGSAADPTVSVPSSDPAPSTPASSPGSTSPSVSASVPASVSVGGSGVPSVAASVPASVAASVSVGGSGARSVAASVSVSASVAPSVSVGGSGVPSVSASVPVSVSASVAPSVSASSASAAAGACLSVGPLGVCLKA